MISVIIPTYGHFDYAARAIHSLFENTEDVDVEVVVVDDASPDWCPPLVGVGNGYLAGLSQTYGADRVFLHRFEQNGGLTRSWNHGLWLLQNRCRTYPEHITCVTNSDVLFTPGWDVPLRHALDNGYDLVGPVTNAPGTEGDQNVARYQWPVPYKVDDSKSSLHYTAVNVFYNHEYRVQRGRINGFCMLAKTKTWWKHAFDAEHVFKPRNDFNSKGQPNPTPLMTLNEYELQKRWRDANLKIGFCVGSFVFHYRSVSRGDRYNKPGWYRKK